MARTTSRVGVGCVALALAALGLAAPQAAAVTCQARDLTARGAVSGDLQAVLDAAAAGDVVAVSGLCVGHFTITKPLILRTVPGARMATLDGDATGRVLTVNTPGVVTVRHLRVQNGRAMKPPTATVQGLLGGGSGGGIYSQQAELRVFGSRIVNNVARRRGVGGGICVANGSVTMRHTVVWGNKATGGLGGGGGIAVGLFSPAYLEDVRIVGNKAHNQGGGIVASGHLTLSGKSVVARNTAVDDAGGIAFYWDVDHRGSLVLADRSRIWGNRTSASGGGIYLDGDDEWSAGIRIRMTDRATIAGNVARVDGGGMFIWQNSGATVTMTGNSSIRDNKARNGHGGGAVMLSSSRLTMMGYAVIAGNRTSGGGGGVLGDTVFMQGHSAIRRNGARWGGGAAISYAGAMSLQDRAVVSDNTATWLGGGILAISPAPVRVRDDAQVSGNHPSNIVHHADGFRPWPTYPYRIVVRRS